MGMSLNMWVQTKGDRTWKAEVQRWLNMICVERQPRRGKPLSGSSTHGSVPLPRCTPNRRLPCINTVSIISSPRPRPFFPSLLILSFSNSIDHRRDGPIVLTADRFYLNLLISMTNKADHAVGVLASAGWRVLAFHPFFFFFFFWNPFLCVLGYRTPCGTSSMYKIIVVAMCDKVVKCRVISPITGLSLRNVYCGVSDERGNSAPGCHCGM